MFPCAPPFLVVTRKVPFIFVVSFLSVFNICPKSSKPYNVADWLRRVYGMPERGNRRTPFRITLKMWLFIEDQ